MFGAEGCQLALENSVKLLSVCRNYESLPIVFTEVKYKNGGEDGGAFYKKVPALSCFDEGKKSQEIHSDFKLIKSDILITMATKTSVSAITGSFNIVNAPVQPTIE